MKQAVKDQIVAFNIPFEGRRRHLYLDVKQNVSTGVGILLKDQSAICRPDFPFTIGWDGPPASDAEKIQAWNTIHDLPKTIPDFDVKKNPSREDAADIYGEKSKLRLRYEDVDNLTMNTAKGFDNTLRNEFPDYDNFPADAQLALLSMMWGMGGDWKDWPNLHQHVKDQNWFAAAKECYFDPIKSPGTGPRNIANRWLFSLAGRVKGMNLNPDILYYHNTDKDNADKLYFIKGKEYIRYSINTNAVDPGYPLALSAWNIPLPFSEGIDAMVNGFGEEKVPKYFGKTYFFKDSQYIRYDWDTNRVDFGPAPLTAWGLTDEFSQKIDAALNGRGKWSGKLYFFRGPNYVRYDWVKEQIDFGPVSIKEYWKVQGPFEKGIDAAVNGEGSDEGKFFFFKDDSYMRGYWKEGIVEPAIEKIIIGWGNIGNYNFGSNLSAVCPPPGKS